MAAVAFVVIAVVADVAVVVVIAAIAVVAVVASVGLTISLKGFKSGLDLLYFNPGPEQLVARACR